MSLSRVFKIFIHLLISIFAVLAFIAVFRLSLVAASRGYSNCRAWGLGAAASLVAEYRL